MNTREALVAAVAATPDDDLPKLVLADHLDEKGEDSTRLRWWVCVRPSVAYVGVPAVVEAGPPGYYSQLLTSAPAWLTRLALVAAARLAFTEVSKRAPKAKLRAARPAILTLLHGAEMMAVGVIPPWRCGQMVRSAAEAVVSQKWRHRAGEELWSVARTAERCTFSDPYLERSDSWWWFHNAVRLVLPGADWHTAEAATSAFTKRFAFLELPQAAPSGGNQ